MNFAFWFIRNRNFYYVKDYYLFIFKVRDGYGTVPLLFSNE